MASHYSGDLRDGRRHGQGAMGFSNGDRYEGQWRKGLMEGSGTMKYANGDTYIGQWRKGLLHGKGAFHWANGEVYDGSYRRGERVGQGVMRYKNFDEYSGEWKGDAHSGYGVYRYSCGDVFRGTYKDGVKHGSGEYHYKNGDHYSGGFINDKYSGRGLYSWAGDASFDGDYRGGRRNGFGVYRSEAGVYEGEWRDGHRHGYGIYRYPDGESRMGMWEKDLLKQQWDSAPRQITAVHNAFLLGLKRDRDNAMSGVRDPITVQKEQRSRAALKEQWDARPAADTLSGYIDLLAQDPHNAAVLGDRAAFYEHLAAKAQGRQESLYRKALEDFDRSLAIDARDGEATYGHARVSNILSSLAASADANSKGTLPSVSKGRPVSAKPRRTR